MSLTKVVFLTSLRQPVIDEIVYYAPDNFEIVVLNSTALESDCIKQIRDADFLLCHGRYPTDEMLRAAVNCRLVQLLAAGYDQINLDLLSELEIPCANNGGANSWAVADHAVLLMLATYKRLFAAQQSTRNGTWNKPINGENTFEMADKKIGIIGMGNIGRKVAKRVQAFDANVQYFDLFPLNPNVNQDLKIESVSIEVLFERSDIITSHIPLNKNTHHMVNQERLSMMKPSAILINTSRGSLIDELALIEALNQGTIAAAGLDVFEKEPVEISNPLLKMDNVIVTPHMAGTTWDTWSRRCQFGFENMKRSLVGEEISGVI